MVMLLRCHRWLRRSLRSKFWLWWLIVKYIWQVWLGFRIRQGNRPPSSKDLSVQESVLRWIWDWLRVFIGTLFWAPPLLPLTVQAGEDGCHPLSTRETLSKPCGSLCHLELSELPYYLTCIHNLYQERNSDQDHIVSTFEVPFDSDLSTEQWYCLCRRTV